MVETINLRKVDMKKKLRDGVMFFAIAERGAMGEPGAVIFFVENGEAYYFNYVYGDVDIRRVEKLFPVLTDFKQGIFDEDGSNKKGWNYFYMGMGNHLFVNEKVNSSFKEKIGTDEDPSVLYSKWVEVAEEILKSN